VTHVISNLLFDIVEANFCRLYIVVMFHPLLLSAKIVTSCLIGFKT